MTSDGRWNYAWDAENRLLRVQSRSDTPQGSWRRVEWQYDALGRRIRQTTSNWLVQSNLWAVTEDLKFLSDPLLFARHVVDLNASNNVAVRTYVWGLDLSETMDGAGGVGGLLWMTLHTGSGPAAGTHFAAYDGNGNVVALSAASDGSETARYEYGPFGEPLRLTGPAATNNPFRFSTKRTDNTTDLVLYEFRAYVPSLGRWVSRDPISEGGGVNVYGFVHNAVLAYVDPQGLWGCCLWLRPTLVPRPPTLETPRRWSWPTPPSRPAPPPGPYPPVPGTPPQVPPVPSPSPGPAPAEVPCPPLPPDRGGPPWKYGRSDCPPEELAALQKQMHAICDQPRSCKGITDCLELYRRIQINQQCLGARLHIMEKCFCGGDERHRNTAKEVLDVLKECLKRWYEAGGAIPA